MVFVHFDAGRSRYGHKEIAVLTREQAEETLIASSAERAIIAATTTMQFGIIDAQVGVIDTRRLRRALGHIDEPLTKSAEEHRRTTAEKMHKTSELDSFQQRKQKNQQALEFQWDLQTPSLEYVLALLRYSRPNFDALPRQEQVGLILQTCERINAFLKSLRDLMSFLEYGTPEGLSNKPVTRIHRNVQAAVLREVVGLSHREIGRKLGLEVPPSSKEKGGHATVSRAIKRGLTFLENLLGKEGWRERRGSMKAEAERYNALSKEERHIEDRAGRWGVSKEEARKRYERERPRFPDIPRGLSGIPEEELLDHLRNLEEEEEEEGP